MTEELGRSNLQSEWVLARASLRSGLRLFVRQSANPEAVSGAAVTCLCSQVICGLHKVHKHCPYQRAAHTHPNTEC